MSISSPLLAQFMAVKRVESRLKVITSTLNKAGIAYAVVGGNAVAAWVARKNPHATRATPNVDLLINRVDENAVAVALLDLGFERQPLPHWTVFREPDEPSRHSVVHFLFAEEFFRSSYSYKNPSFEEVVFDKQNDFHLLDLPALVRMKLISNRNVDRAHLADLLRVGAIDKFVCESLPEDLLDTLRDLESGLLDHWLGEDYIPIIPLLLGSNAQ